MMTLFGPLLVAALMAQFQGGMLHGTVVDDRGKPAAGAQVVFHAPAPWGGKAEPVEVRVKTDADGRFRLTTPSLGNVSVIRANVWAYRPGSAITAAPGYQPLAALVTRLPERRTLKIEGPDGQPVAGALVSPRVISFDASSSAVDMPDTLAAPRAVTTGPDGTATLNYLAARDLLIAVRVVANSIGARTSSSSNGLTNAPLRERRSPSGSSRRAGSLAMSETVQASRSQTS